MQPEVENLIGKLWEKFNKKINIAIGKLMVPAMTSGIPLVEEVHQELIDLANWFDEQMEEINSYTK